jgi:hypothetical protein
LYFGKIILGHVPKESIEYNCGMQSGVQIIGFNVEVLRERPRKMTDSVPRRLGDVVPTHSFVVRLVSLGLAQWPLLNSEIHYVPE